VKDKELQLARFGSMILFLYAFLNQLCLSVTLIALPILAHSMEASPFLIGLIGAGGGISYAAMTRIFTRTFEEFSRTKLFLGAELVQAVSMLMCFVSENPYELILARFVLAAGSALFWPLIESYIADLSEPRRLGRDLMRFNVSWSVAAIVGPQLGGFLITWFFTKTVFLLSFFLLIFVSILLLLPRTDSSVTKSAQIFNMHNDQTLVLTKESSKIAPLLYVFLFGFNTAILSGLFPAYATQLGISADLIGFMFLLSSFTQTLMFFSADKLQPKVGERVLLSVSSLLFFGALLIISMSASVTPLFFFCGFALFGVAQGMTYSTAMILILKENYSRRRAAALFESTLGVGFTIGPLVGGILYQIGGEYPYLLSALYSLSIAVVSTRAKIRFKHLRLADSYSIL
jgi:MFS family permease